MKKIIISLVVLLGLGGGAYYTQASGLYDLKQFIPAQVTNYLPTSLKDSLGLENTEKTTVSLNELENIETQSFEIPAQQQIIGEGFPQQNMMTTDQMGMPPMTGQPTDQEMGQESNQIIEDVNINNVNNIAPALQDASSQLQQSTPMEATNNTLAANNINSNNYKSLVTPTRDIQALAKTPEEKKIVKKLNKIESSIVKLDNENEDLQVRYNKMLKENRELALKIKEIDHKIKSLNSQ